MANALRIPTQQELVFAAVARRREIRDAAEFRVERIESEVKRVVDLRGAKEFADRLGLEDETLIHHWCARRGGRRMPVELADYAIDLDDGDRVAQAVMGDRYELKRVVRLSPEQQIAAMRRALKEFGAAGEKKLQDIEQSRPELGL